MGNFSKASFLDFCDLGVNDIDGDSKYSSKVEVPQYLPSIVCPNIQSLCDTTKYEELVNEIDISDVPQDVKEFLRFAATRHIVFNYSLIADYYAHASKDVQELMEKSALVIIDIDDAIANGYVKMSKNIEKIMRETGRNAGEEWK